MRKNGGDTCLGNGHLYRMSIVQETCIVVLVQTSRSICNLHSNTIRMSEILTHRSFTERFNEMKHDLNNFCRGCSIATQTQKTWVASHFCSETSHPVAHTVRLVSTEPSQQSRSFDRTLHFGCSVTSLDSVRPSHVSRLFWDWENFFLC